MSHVAVRRASSAAFAAAFGIVLSGTTSMAAVVVDFDEHPHGRVMHEQHAPQGLHISATNLRGGPHLAVAFDTRLASTEDPDLQDAWDSGNLSPGTDLGVMMIVAEGSTDRDKDGLIDRPDDQRGYPGGELTFRFDDVLDSFGFDVLDVDNGREIGPNVGYVAFRLAGVEVARVSFGEFIRPESPHYDRTVVYGNNSANRITPITAAALNVPGFNEVAFRLASGGVDTLTYTPIPEPAAAGALVLAAATLLGRQRRV
jgi:hypothetical protein